MPNTTQTYPLAVHSWRSARDPILVRHARTSILIASFPVEFIEKGGDNSWRYVIGVVEQLVNNPPLSRRGLLKDASGWAVQADNPVHSGVFWYEIAGLRNDGLKFSTGPEYFRSTVPPSAEGSVSTRSNSKRSSVNQSRFREYLIARDSSCLVTDVVFTSCTASHIVPFSRPDIYQRVMEIPYEPPLFDPSVGLLLRDDLHHAFNRLQWSFYYQDGVYYAHFFVLSYPGAWELHEKAITQERFRGDAEWRPDPRLIAWHYNQCLKARIRGFAVGYGESERAEEVVTV